MNKYSIKIVGQMDNVTNTLEAILERQNSELNSYEGFDFERLTWGIRPDGLSEANGVFSIENSLKTNDIRIMREEYVVDITTKKVKEVVA